MARLSISVNGPSTAPWPITAASTSPYALRASDGAAASSKASPKNTPRVGSCCFRGTWMSSTMFSPLSPAAVGEIMSGGRVRLTKSLRRSPVKLARSPS